MHTKTPTIFLQLLGTPAWQGLHAGSSRLPNTLPTCLLIYLACHARWLDRDAVAEVFWPGRAREEARHNLRINLHRVKQLLAIADLENCLLSERTRICLQLPLDTDALQAAMKSGDGAQLLALHPAAWLEGFYLADFEVFWNWAQQHGEHLHRQWRNAAELAIRNSSKVNGVPPAWLPALRQLLDAKPSGSLSMPVSDTDDDDDSVTPAGELFGRKSILQNLRQLQSRAMVLTGEAGIGKSSLLNMAFKQAPILHGREGLRQIPYRPVVEYLQLHIASLRRQLQSSDGLMVYRLDLARLLPELAPNDPLPPLDLLTAKVRLLEALARVLEASNPWLLIDDLQWCDDATLELLSLLSHRGVLRWRAAARSNELSDYQRNWLESLRQTGHLTVLPVTGLDLETVQQYCQHQYPQHAWKDADFIRLHAASTGNPFILREFILHEASQMVDDSQFTGDVATGCQQRTRQLPGIFRRRREEHQLPQRVLQMLQQRLQTLSPSARALVEAAAVLVQPLPVNVLMQIADLDASQQMAAAKAARAAMEADFLREETRGLLCRHDLVRYAVENGLSMPHLQALHRRAALALGARAEGDSDPLAVAAHWSAAQEPQTALAWMLRAAAQCHLRGHFDEARSLWQQVAAESLDATQALHARLALANCELLSDLKRGRIALQEVLDQLAAVADPVQRAQIEGQALSGLVDNAVFSGDLLTARHAAQKLRPLLPQLRSEDRNHACEALIELAMREPDIASAWALLDQLRRQAPRRPSISSYEAQIHWFSGDVRAARDAFESMLLAYPDYCRGLTIENDLAVLLHALGDLARAEDMARRSLLSWAGVAHTETLSQLALASILTSGGRYDAALAAVNTALDLGRQQTSAMFEAEAMVRRSRIYLQCGRYAHAMSDLEAATDYFKDNHSPLPVSQYAMLRLLCQISLGANPAIDLLPRLHELAKNSTHPLLQARIARIDHALACYRKDVAAAYNAARRQADIARTAGLQEVLCEALLLQAYASKTDVEQSRALLEEAANLAQAQGYVELAWRAHRALAASNVMHQTAAQLACKQLTGDTTTPLFLEMEARRGGPFLNNNPT